MSGAENLIQTFQHLREFLRRCPTEAPPNPLDRKRTDLTDLHPGALWQAWCGQLERERKSGALRLARQRDCNHSSGPLVEDVVTEDQHRALTGLLRTARGIEIRPADLAPQYSGHPAASKPSPSSAMARSATGSSLAHSSARRRCSSRSSWAAIAAS